MASSKERQVSFCLRKLNLDEIENSLQSNLLMLPELEKENDQQIRDTLASLRNARAVDAEIKALKHENGRLTVKREVVRRECNTIIEMSEKAIEHNLDIERLILQEENDRQCEVLNYVKNLKESLNQFRHSFNINEEEIIRHKTGEANVILSQLLPEVEKNRNDNIKLQETYDGMKSDVPENILEIIGQKDLEEKLKTLIDQCEKLQ